MIWKLLPFMRRYWLPALLCPTVVVLEVIIDVLMPRLMAQIVDVGIASQDVEFIARTGLIMVGLAVVALGIGIASSWLGATASMGFGSEIRRALFEKVQSFSFARLDKFGVPSLITRLTNDVNNLQNVSMMGLRMAFRAPFMLILALIMAFSINSQLALVFLAAIPVLSIGLILIMSKAYPRFRAMQKKLDAMNTTVQENLISIRVVKAFVRAAYEKTRFREANNNLMKAALHAIQLVIINMPMMQLILYACIIAILWFGGGMVNAGSLKTGELISFIFYVNQIMMSLMMLSMIFMMSTRAKASGERIIDVLKTDPGMDEPDPTSLADQDIVADGTVEFRQVSFRYAGEDQDEQSDSTDEFTLNDINLSIKSGETLGIIGATGSAKTTLISLIPRLYDAVEGQVLVGGRDVRDYSLRTLRDSVAVVLQNNTLFTGTIRENLHWGKADADDAELMAACRIAQAAEFIERMPDGLNTMLGQGGVNLSGGQKQRLCIARALLKKPKILILDDSTSAV
ncbi:MAG TPA: ABC transporter, partial [Clostridiales bacterium]|nr:ABC transporter [Clostridiales bacterium]